MSPPASRAPVKYERIHGILHALDPKDWVDLDGAGERFALRADVNLHLVLEEVVDGEEIGECCGVLPDKYETFVLRLGHVELADYTFAVMDRRTADVRVVPYGYEEDGDRVSLPHYHIGCLVYGQDVMDAGLKEFKIRLAVEGGPRGLR